MTSTTPPAGFDFSALVRSGSNVLEFEPGEVIIETGDRGDSMFVLLEGTVDVLAAGRDLCTLGAGSLFGEMAILNDGPRSATVRAQTAVRVVPMDKKRFLYLTEQTPFFALHVMRMLSDRLRRMTPST